MANNRNVNRASELFIEIKNNIEIVFSNNEDKINENNWYINASIIVEMLKIVFEINTEKIKKHVIFHILDSLMFSDKLILLKEIYTNDFVIKNELQKTIKDYFDDIILLNDKKDRRAIVLLSNNEKWKIFMLPFDRKKEDEIMEANPEDLNKFTKSLASKLYVINEKLNDLISFTNYKDNKMVLNIKDLTQKRNNTGAMIENAGKKAIIKRLNDVIGSQKFTVENTKRSSTNKGISEMCLAIIFEFLVREYNDLQKNEKIWYLSPEKASINQIEKRKII